MRTALPGPDGVPCATYIRTDEGGRTLAQDLRPRQGVPPARVARAALDELRGCLVGLTEGPLEAELLAAGAVPQRRAEVLRIDLATVPPRSPAAPPPGTTVVPLRPDGVPSDLGAVVVRAYPAGHPDGGPGTTPASAQAELERIAGGRLTGPLLPASSVACGPDGATLGAVLVNDLPQTGPWITELFRAPAAAGTGLGALLLDHAIAGVRAAGDAGMALAVTAGNPARRLYVSRGFVPHASAVTLLLPG